MAYESSIAPYGINKYVWAVLQEVLDWDEDDYGGNTPIVPSNQEQEFLAYDKPFIVYGYGLEAKELLTTEQMAYTIYSRSGAEIGRVINLLTDALSRGAQSAIDVNRVVDGYHFKHIDVTGFSGPEAESEQGGRHSGMMLIRYTFGRDITAVPGLISKEV